MASDETLGDLETVSGDLFLALVKVGGVFFLTANISLRVSPRQLHFSLVGPRVTNVPTWAVALVRASREDMDRLCSRRHTWWKDKESSSVTCWKWIHRLISSVDEAAAIVLSTLKAQSNPPVVHCPCFPQRYFERIDSARGVVRECIMFCQVGRCRVHSSSWISLRRVERVGNQPLGCRAVAILLEDATREPHLLPLALVHCLSGGSDWQMF